MRPRPRARRPPFGVHIPVRIAPAVLAIVGLLAARSSRAEPPSLIRLRSRAILPAAAPAMVRAQLERSLAPIASAAAPAHLLVQFRSRPDPATRQRLAAAGVVLLGAIPEHTFIAAVKPGTRPDDLLALGVIWMEPFGAADKLAPNLLDALNQPITGARGAGFPEHIRRPDGRVALYVEFHGDIPLETGITEVARLDQMTVEGRVGSLNGVILDADPERLAELAACSSVKWIEPVSPAFSDLNDGIRRAIGVETVQDAPYNLAGRGVSVLVYDGGLVCDTQTDLAPRVIQGESGFQSTHATHVAGTLAGNGVASLGKFRGMAPEVKIISYAYESCTPLCLYNNPQDLEENYREAALTYGAAFASNSIGANIAANGYDCSLLGDYENTARLVDAIACGSFGRPFLSIWAAGNERQGAGRCGSGFFTTGVPATAKNSIVVGATLSDDGTVASFSSFGPVDDGRMRPDLVAPGCESGGDHGITSLRACVGQTVFCGTSMSTPAVAGAAALVLERLRGTPRGGISWPATMKALLACSARDIANPGPDYMTGYGLVDVVAAVGLVDSGTIIESRLSDGDIFTRTLEVGAGGGRLRAVLAWDDVPGEPLAARSLVNDLDLRLVSPTGDVRYAYVLDPQAPASDAKRGANRRDPSEMVEVDHPSPGPWRLEVEGFDIPAGPQNFAVVADAPVDQEVAIGDHPAPGAGGGLAQNAPNPFNPATTIRFELSEDGPASLRITDLRGNVVRTLVEGWHRAGAHEVRWDGRDDRGRRVASGAYFYTLQKTGGRETRRMVLLK